MPSRVLSVLLILAIACCPIMCRLGVCACDDSNPEAVSCCCCDLSENAADDSLPSDRDDCCRKTCICGGALQGDTVQFEVDTTTSFLLICEASTPGWYIADYANLHSTSPPKEVFVTSGKMIRYQLMSILC